MNMQIRGLSNNPLFVNNPKGKQTGATNPEEPKDKIEISTAARNMAKSELSQQRLEEIKNRLDSKFYESEEVLNKVADKLLKDIQSK